MTQSIGPGRIAKIAHALALAKRDGPESLSERELAVFAQGDWNQIHHDLTELAHSLPNVQMYLRYQARRGEFEKLSTEELTAYLDGIASTQSSRARSKADARKADYTKYSVEYIIGQILQSRLEADTQD